jgi:rubrerythrin
MPTEIMAWIMDRDDLLNRREFVKLLGVAAMSASAGAGAGYFFSEYNKPKTAETWLADITEQNLKNAFSGESQANVRYTVFGNKAQEEGFSNVSRLFAAITFAEQVHAGNHFEILSYLNEASVANGMAGFGPGDTSKNLGMAVDGETFEITEMYPAYREKATQEGVQDAELSFSRALEAEKSHLGLFKKAKGAVDSGQDMQVGKIYICPVCGNAFGDEAPDTCPICGTRKEKFRIY